MTDLKKKKLDPYRNLKHIGYKMSQLPNTYGLADLVRYAKFQLATKTNRLLKDPIWDEYTVEELLSEFFAHQFEDSKEFRIRFENEIGDINGEIDDFATWADKRIAEDNKIREKTMGELEDRVVFNPADIMGDE